MYDVTIFYGVRQKTNTFKMSSVLNKVFNDFLFFMFYTKIRMMYCTYCTTGALPLCSLHRWGAGFHKSLCILSNTERSCTAYIGLKHFHNIVVLLLLLLQLLHHTYQIFPKHIFTIDLNKYFFSRIKVPTSFHYLFFPLLLIQYVLDNLLHQFLYILFLHSVPQPNLYHL